MITYEMIIEAQKFLVDEWGEDGKRVIEECAKITPFNGDSDTFLAHCTCCGGNWGGMLLTGIKALYPNVWEAIPDDMGCFAFLSICHTLVLCGVDTSKKGD
jgi:hypothetical protein